MPPTAAATPEQLGDSRDDSVRASGLRQIVEAFLCLALAVVLFRTFEVEGYMISTGSMAPTLLGYHKQVECPSCGYHFAYGVSAEGNGEEISSSTRNGPAPQAPDIAGKSRPTDQNAPREETAGQLHEAAVCPNCGEAAIDISRIPRNQGDQLLVHKNAFLYQPPRRWDVAVFRNPNKPTQAYVKRIVGLPGETVRIFNGDVYIDGTIRRKNLQLQRAICIGVYDNNYQSSADPNWQPRWISETEQMGWKSAGSRFQFESRPTGSLDEPSDWSWVRYRHWIRNGGDHKTWVKLEAHEGTIRLPDLQETPVRFDPADGTLACTGALSAYWRDRLLEQAEDAVFRRAIEELYRQSHQAPITDLYGYNPFDAGDWTTPVRDLMVSLELDLFAGKGEFALEMTDGRQNFQTVLNFDAREVSLTVDDARKPVRVGGFTWPVEKRPLLLEMSLVDQQVLIAVDGREVFMPWVISSTAEYGPPPRTPVRFGARDVRLQVENIKLSRDVYYTHKGSGESLTLGVDEYFVMGDNSPISFDSRSWKNGAVEGRMFLGKPIFVHLPSRPGFFKLGEQTFHIRIPDVSRIRYIR